MLKSLLLSIALLLGVAQAGYTDDNHLFGVFFQEHKTEKEVKGVVVLTKSSNTIMGQKMESSTELLEYKTGKAPASAFTVPQKGYKKQSMPGGAPF